MDDDELAPVMPAIDAVQQLLEEEEMRLKLAKKKKAGFKAGEAHTKLLAKKNDSTEDSKSTVRRISSHKEEGNLSLLNKKRDSLSETPRPARNDRNRDTITATTTSSNNTRDIVDEEDDYCPLVRANNPLNDLFINSHFQPKKQEEYEFIPKSVILDVYSNDPEVKRFLKQLPKIGIEFGLNEQDYKCYSCRRPIGMVFGQPKLCSFDGHHYCSECHLNEKSSIPARILCNWDFEKYPVSKRNQHFLALISNEPMFELKSMAPLLYTTCPELREIEELRYQAFSIRSYCFTCVQDSISFELTKLVWPREHLIKQIDQYSLEDLVQIKSGALKTILKNVIHFGKTHVLSCMLCCQKGFICELCKSSQIIYPFETESIHRCNSCQSIYHKTCFKSRPNNSDDCPRCLRLLARRNGDGGGS